MDMPPPSITDMEIEATEATFSPFTFEEIKTFDQPWLEILDMDEFNSIVTDKSEVTTLGDIPMYRDKGTPPKKEGGSSFTVTKLPSSLKPKKQRPLSLPHSP